MFTLLALHANVPVKHKLASLRARAGKAHAIDHVVEPTLEHYHQVRAGGALGALGLLEIVAELAFEQAVGALHFLFFAQLYAVTNHLGAPCLAVLAGNEVALFNGAFFCKAPEAFQEEFHPFPAAQPANSFAMSCQVLLSFASAATSRV